MMKPQPTEIFAGNLKAWRQNAGIPLKAVSKEMGVSIATVSDWERGARFPTGEHLNRISEYTGIPLCAFFHNGERDCRYQNALK